MTIGVGTVMPEATLLRMGDRGPEQVLLSDLLKGRRVVLFGLPGAFTGTCSTLHVPSFIRTAAAFRAKGVDDILCLATDTPHVMKAWGEATGGTAAGISFLADPGSDLVVALGMDFSAPAAGFYKRCKRFSAFIEDGVVRVFNPEPPGGECEISAGETLLAQI
jgi:peroxiredoxin